MILLNSAFATFTHLGTNLGTFSPYFVGISQKRPPKGDIWGPRVALGSTSGPLFASLGPSWDPLVPHLTPLGTNFGHLGCPRPLPGCIIHQMPSIFTEKQRKNHQLHLRFASDLLFPFPTDITDPFPSASTPIPLTLQSSKHPSIQGGTAECAERLNHLLT